MKKAKIMKNYSPFFTLQQRDKNEILNGTPNVNKACHKNVPVCRVIVSGRPTTDPICDHDSVMPTRIYMYQLAYLSINFVPIGFCFSCSTDFHINILD